MFMIEPLLLLFILSLVIGAAYWIFRPQTGLFWRMERSKKGQQRIQREDALKHILRSENYGRLVTLESLAGALAISTAEAADVLGALEQKELVDFDGSSFGLSAEGRDYALHVVRAHRLWERYLADETGYSEEDWHERADKVEHQLTPDNADALAAELGFPTHDPHGDPIPTALGSLVPHGGQPLSSVSPNTTVRLVHLEDEPEAIYAQLVAERLSPGMIAEVVEVSAERVRFWANGEEHLLAPLVAANISVVPIEEPAEPEVVGQPLSSLQPGQKATVLSLSQASRGSERRRFMDLGILPGTLVSAETRSPSGDPTAYRIRDALIALRSEQAEKIRVKPIEEPE